MLGYNSRDYKSRYKIFARKIIIPENQKHDWLISPDTIYIWTYKPHVQFIIPYANMNEIINYT
jgi:hypothetical protein